MAVAIAAVLLAAAVSMLIKRPSNEDSAAHESVPAANNGYGLAVYCFEGAKTVSGAAGKTLSIFVWDLAKSSNHAYRYIDSSVTSSEGEYQVSQRVETLPNAPASGLAWGPDASYDKAYYKGLGLRAWISAWGGKEFTLLLKENNGKLLGKWNYTGQSVLYMGAASSTTGMGIAMNDWKAGSWSPSQSMFFECQTSTGLKINNASLDVMVMLPQQVLVPEYEILIPVFALLVAIPFIRRKILSLS